MIYEKFEEMMQAVPYERTTEGRYKYHKERKRISLLFKEALEKEYQTWDSPQKDEVWRILNEWENSFSEIESKYLDLAVLIWIPENHLVGQDLEDYQNSVR